MKNVVTALTVFLVVGSPAQAAKAEHNKHCLVEVLHSEELAIAPLFYHAVKATLLISAPHASPAETTVYKVIPWQVPPPREGQKFWIHCDRAPLDAALKLSDGRRAGHIGNMAGRQKRLVGMNK